MKTKQISLSFDHMCAAVEGYLKALSMLNDDKEVISVKQDQKTGSFYIEVEK